MLITVETSEVEKAARAEEAARPKSDDKSTLYLRSILDSGLARGRSITVPLTRSRPISIPFSLSTSSPSLFPLDSLP